MMDRNTPNRQSAFFGQKVLSVDSACVVAAAPHDPIRASEALRAPEVMRPPEMRAPEMRAPEMRAPEMRAPEMRAPEMMSEVPSFELRPPPQPPNTSAMYNSYSHDYYSPFVVPEFMANPPPLPPPPPINDWSPAPPNFDPPHFDNSRLSSNSFHQSSYPRHNPPAPRHHSRPIFQNMQLDLRHERQADASDTRPDVPFQRTEHARHDHTGHEHATHENTRHTSQAHFHQHSFDGRRGHENDVEGESDSRGEAEDGELTDEARASVEPVSFDTRQLPPPQTLETPQESPRGDPPNSEFWKGRVCVRAGSRPPNNTGSIEKDDISDMVILKFQLLDLSPDSPMLNELIHEFLPYYRRCLGGSAFVAEVYLMSSQLEPSSLKRLLDCLLHLRIFPVALQLSSNGSLGSQGIACLADFVWETPARLRWMSLNKTGATGLSIQKLFSAVLARSDLWNSKTCVVPLWLDMSGPDLQFDPDRDLFEYLDGIRGGLYCRASSRMKCGITRCGNSGALFHLPKLPTSRPDFPVSQPPVKNGTSERSKNDVEDDDGQLSCVSSDRSIGREVEELSEIDSEDENFDSELSPWSDESSITPVSPANFQHQLPTYRHDPGGYDSFSIPHPPVTPPPPPPSSFPIIISPPHLHSRPQDKPFEPPPPPPPDMSHCSFSPLSSDLPPAPVPNPYKSEILLNAYRKLLFDAYISLSRIAIGRLIFPIEFLKDLSNLYQLRKPPVTLPSLWTGEARDEIVNCLLDESRWSAGFDLASMDVAERPNELPTQLPSLQDATETPASDAALLDFDAPPKKRRRVEANSRKAIRSSGKPTSTSDAPQIDAPNIQDTSISLVEMSSAAESAGNAHSATSSTNSSAVSSATPNPQSSANPLNANPNPASSKQSRSVNSKQSVKRHPTAISVASVSPGEVTLSESDDDSLEVLDLEKSAAALNDLDLTSIRRMRSASAEEGEIG